MPLFTRFIVTEALDAPYTSIKWDWSDLGYVKVTFRTDPGLDYDVIFQTSNPRPVFAHDDDDGGRYYDPTAETTTNIEFRLDSASIEKVKSWKVNRGDYSSYTGPFSVNQAGDSFRVFATVVKIIQIFAAKMQPDEMTFSASEPSREKLYDRFVHNVDRGLPEYRATSHAYTGGGKSYTFTRKFSPNRPTKSQKFAGSDITIARPSTDADAYPTTHIPATPTKPPVAQEAVEPVYAQIIEALGSPYPLGTWHDDNEQNTVSFTAANNMTYVVTMTPADNEDEWDEDDEGDFQPSYNWDDVTVEFRLGTDSYQRAVDAEAERAAKAGVAQRYFGSYGVARTGDAFRVFATVVAVVKELARRRTPDTIHFTATEPSRTKLYDRFMKDVERALPNYEAESSRSGSTTYYSFHRKGSFSAQNARHANEIRPRQDTLGALDTPNRDTFNRTGSRDSLRRSGTSVTIPGPLRHDATFPTTHVPAAPRKPSPVTEAFTTPYPFEWDSAGYNNRQKATFTTDAGLVYEATFHPKWERDEDDSSSEWEFEFEIEYHSMQKLRKTLPDEYIGPYDITGTGDAFRVFATMIAIMKDFIQNQDPPMITFIATEKSRVKLYDRFAKEVTKAFPSYKGIVYKGSESHHYEFKRREDAPTVGGRPRLTEALTSPYPWEWKVQGATAWIGAFKGKYEYRVTVMATRGRVEGSAAWGVKSGEWDVVFSPSETSYHQMIDAIPPHNSAQDPWELQRDRRSIGPYDMTHAGDSFRVMATVVAIVLDFIKQERPKILRFTAGDDEPGRLKLYKRFVQKIQTVASDYTGKHTVEPGRPNSYASFSLVRN